MTVQNFKKALKSIKMLIMNQVAQITTKLPKVGSFEYFKSINRLAEEVPMMYDVYKEGYGKIIPEKYSFALFQYDFTIHRDCPDLNNVRDEHKIWKWMVMCEAHYKSDFSSSFWWSGGDWQSFVEFCKERNAQYNPKLYDFHTIKCYLEQKPELVAMDYQTGELVTINDIK